MKKIFFITIAILNIYFSATALADDLYFNDSLYYRQWYYEAVHAKTYRDNGIDGTGVRVGIVDTGFDKDLPDFNYDNITMTNVRVLHGDDIEDITDIPDSRNHGVPITAIIAAQADNNIGIAGLTDNVYINEYKKHGILDAIYLAYQDGCDVVNVSMGYDEGTNKESITTDYPAIDYATQDGMIIISAVGNNGNSETNLNSYDFPAVIDKVIAVGSVEPTCDKERIWYNNQTGVIGDKFEIINSAGIKMSSGTDTWLTSTITNNPDTSYVKCDHSTANDSIFVSAPGTSIISEPCISEKESDLNFWGYAQEWHTCSGTSFAAPIVTAAAIGVKQMRPYVDTDMFKEILKATSIDLDEEGYDINTGWGMVDFQAIYDYVSQMPETIPMATPEIEIDYENGVLKGFQSKYDYQNYELQEQVLSKYDYYINGEKITPNYPKIDPNTQWSKLLDTPIGEIPIDESWYGKDISIVIKSKGDGFTDSEPQILSIPAVPEAPDFRYEIIFDDEGLVSLVDGLTEEMEYRKVGLNEWQTGDITSAGEYEIRYRATDSSFPSLIYVVTFEDKEIEDEPGDNPNPSPDPEPDEPDEPTQSYDVETTLTYDDGYIGISYINNTDTIVTGKFMVAIYDENNCLSMLRIFTNGKFSVGKHGMGFRYENDNMQSIKFFAWDNLSTLKPIAGVQTSEWRNEGGV